MELLHCHPSYFIIQMYDFKTISEYGLTFAAINEVEYITLNEFSVGRRKEFPAMSTSTKMQARHIMKIVFVTNASVDNARFQRTAESSKGDHHRSLYLSNLREPVRFRSVLSTELELLEPER